MFINGSSGFGRADTSGSDHAERRPGTDGHRDDSNDFGGSLLEPLMRRPTPLEILRDSRPWYDRKRADDGIRFAQYTGGDYADLFGPDVVRDVDIDIVDVTNPREGDPDPGDLGIITTIDGNVGDLMSAIDRGRRESAVRTSNFGTMTISEGDGWHSTTDSTTGATTTYGTNEEDERTTTVSTAQVQGGTSPRSVVTYTEHADGTVTRRESETSPTGVGYEAPAESVSRPEPPSVPRRSTMESDGSQSTGMGSESRGDGGAGYTSPASVTGSNGMHGGGT